MAGFKSLAQRRKLMELQKEGKISKEVIDKMEEETKNIDSLPERAASSSPVIRRPKYYRRPK